MLQTTLAVALVGGVVATGAMGPLRMRPSTMLEAVVLADLFCREARLRIKDSFRNFYGPNDIALNKVASQVLDGRHEWLEAGIVGGMAEGKDLAVHLLERGPQSPVGGHELPAGGGRGDVGVAHLLAEVTVREQPLYEPGASS